MHNHWRDTDAATLDPIDQLVYQARLIGHEPALALWDGSNTSLKIDETDFAGRPVRVLRILRAGGDLRAAQRSDCTSVRLEDLLLLMAREGMSDVALSDFLAHARLTHDLGLPPIETLLHAVLPQAAVLHTHAEVVSMLGSTPAGDQPLRACFGDAVIVVPHHPTLLQLANALRAAMPANPNARGLVLVNLGLVTWGATAKEAYDRHIELVTQAEAFVEEASSGTKGHASNVMRHATEEGRALALKITPILRGLLSRDKRVVLRFDASDDVLQFLSRPDAQSLLHAGAATPDPMLNIKHAALFLPLPVAERPWSEAEGREGWGEGELRAHLEQHLATASHLPRVIVMPGVGLWAAGGDMRAATAAADIAQRALRIIAGAQALGGYVAAHAAEPSRDESPADKELSRRIALVTGAAHGIGRSIAQRLAAEGAHVVVTDIDLVNAQAVTDEIVQAHGPGRAAAFALDVTSEDQVQRVFDEMVLRYGGLDILVSNAGIAKVAAIADLSLKDWNLSLAINTTGHFLVSRAAMRVLLAQNIGGSLVFNATKNVTAPGKDFGAYSAAKAGEAQLCRILAIEGGPARIRANMVNPDAVLSSNLWSPEIREKRARAQGIPVDQLEDFYTQRNLLKAKITGEDVAEAVFWLASDRSAKTTGAMIPVDGGVREAFPR